MYSLYNGRALGSLFLTVFVIFVSALCPIDHRNVSFISSSSWSRNCGRTSFELDIIDKSMSLVIFMYCTNFRHQSFALGLSCFSRLGMDIFWVHIRSPALIVVSLGIDRLLVDLSVVRFCCPPVYGEVLVGVIHSLFGVGSCSDSVVS